MAQAFKPIRRPKNERVEIKLSDDVLYWKRMKQTAVVQEPGNISSSDFCPVEPYFAAVTSSVRLSLFDTTLFEPMNVYSRFKEEIYGVRIRKDGNLLAIGSREGKVRIFDVQKQTSSGGGPKAPLRNYKAHQAPVHFVVFTSSGQNIVSMADDGSINVFDIAEVKAQPLKTYQSAHSDHIRCGDASKLNQHLFISGSYDHTAKLWSWEKDGEEPLLKVDHGAPIEQSILLPGDSLMATAGEQTVKIWDTVAGGKLIHTMHNHHRNVRSPFSTFFFIVIRRLIKTLPSERHRSRRDVVQLQCDEMKLKLRLRTSLNSIKSHENTWLLMETKRDSAAFSYRISSCARLKYMSTVLRLFCAAARFNYTSYYRPCLCI
ncbi:hypothetical protein AB6A40_010528 [Gnathostoma spinigerum]|uniref:Uncharacterized protein n=1 Tax=Gnathostoma spinigerum TaxID=75299 RepID=A0ABD6EV27_9BILA